MIHKIDTAAEATRDFAEAMSDFALYFAIKEARMEPPEWIAVDRDSSGCVTSMRYTREIPWNIDADF